MIGEGLVAIIRLETGNGTRIQGSQERRAELVQDVDRLQLGDYSIEIGDCRFSPETEAHRATCPFLTDPTTKQHRGTSQSSRVAVETREWQEPRTGRVTRGAGAGNEAPASCQKLISPVAESLEAHAGRVRQTWRRLEVNRHRVGQLMLRNFNTSNNPRTFNRVSK